MSKFFTTSDHITKALDDEHTVTFRKLSYGKQQRIIGKCMVMDPRTQEANVDMALYNLEMLKARLVGWDGPEFTGHPCTAENVENLEPDTAQAILAMMGEVSEDLTEDEKKA